MPKKTVEEIHVDKITRGIKAIMNNKMSPKEANLSKSFEKIKQLNKAMYLDLMNDYKAATKGIPSIE